MVVVGASNYGTEVIISHAFPDGTMKATCRASQTVTRAKRNYSHIKKEGLTLVFAVKMFHRMLHY